MLLSREEMDFDFGGACFDLIQVEDRQLLGWVFNQFLYGEVTGIQCGHWLYRAPHFNAAQFLAKQASEELSHVRKILRILSFLGEAPAPAHWAIRFLSTGMMGGSWGEHVALEMALGEGLVLSVFYAMSRTIRHPEIHRILESAIEEEERHVDFGERETRAWLERHPSGRRILLAQALVQIWVLARLRKFVLKKARSGFGGRDHAVLVQFGHFYDQALQCFELRIQRLGLAQKPIRTLGWFERLGLFVSCLGLIPWERLSRRLSGGEPRLTSTYLSDPLLLAELARPPRSGVAYAEGPTAPDK
jgi:hypothetical protein